MRLLWGTVSLSHSVLYILGLQYTHVRSILCTCLHYLAYTCAYTLSICPLTGGASSPAGAGDDQEPFRDEVEQLLGDNEGEGEEEEEGEDLFGDNLERYINDPPL